MNWKRENFAVQTDSVTPVAISVARMFTRVVLLCACALAAAVLAMPAPPRRDNKDSEKMAQERTIVIRRVPNAYVYPFSLWPLPKYPIREDQTVEYIYSGKALRKLRGDRSKR